VDNIKMDVSETELSEVQPALPDDKM